MEQTLGKRIVAARKRLGLTQDQLAEQLGVTAQAVSKWENDQSCPDITMLPKLAEIFGVTTDALLGIEKKNVRQAELVEKGEEFHESEGFHVENGNWEFQWDGGRKSGVGLAVWLLLTGGLLLASTCLDWGVGFWEILWPSGLLVFGLFGIWPKFSFFPLGCSLFGGYFLLNNLHALPETLGKEVLLPVFILLFGLSLLVDALGKPKKGQFHIHRNGSGDKSRQSHCAMDGEGFECYTSFGEDHQCIHLSRLSLGKAEVSFGELTVDLSGCEEIADGCRLELNCSFGELEVLVPGNCRVEPVTSTAFATVDIKGCPNADTTDTIYMMCNASFGDISVTYI